MPVPPLPETVFPPAVLPFRMSAPVLLEIVPPLPAVPFPVTVNPAVLPVLSSTMPALALLPLAMMLRKVSALAPIVVLATFKAVPVDVVMVLAAPVTLTVPPPVALKPLALVVVMAKLPPVKLIVAPVLVARLTAAPAPVLMIWLALVKATVPLVMFWTEMPVPPVMFSGPEKVMLLVTWP